ncbi:MAG: indole-3-glycerol phosphate synthase TrpC [Pseudomonadota bacterium]
MTILDDIIEYKRDEVAVAKTRRTENDLLRDISDLGETRRFIDALLKKAKTSFALIAEVKKASPSKGVIRADFDPVSIAAAYEAGGAACLSVLTDTPSFQGKPEYLQSIRSIAKIPLLRKDFMVDPYQVAEARAWGADCVLLIMSCLDDGLAAELTATAKALTLDVLVEVHDAREMDRARRLETGLIGINNRNLRTFETRLRTTAELAEHAPEDAILVSESGIAEHQDLVTLSGYGANAFLVGESLMRADDVENATKSLISGA